MGAAIDHVIVSVVDVGTSLAFYQRILGFTHEGEDGPFSIVRASPDFVMLLVQHETRGGMHLAFALDRAAFDACFARIREEGVPFGDRFDNVGTQRGPSPERGARGMAPSLYFFDPSRHLLEIRTYDP